MIAHLHDNPHLYGNALFVGQLYMTKFVCVYDGPRLYDNCFACTTMFPSEAMLVFYDSLRLYGNVIVRLYV